MNINQLTGRISGNLGLRRHFFNTSWLFGARGLRVVSNLFISLYVARYLGPERLGLLAFALSFVGLFRCLSHLGIEGILVRELVLRKDEKYNLLGTSFVLLFWGSALIVLFSMFGMAILKEDAATTFLVFIVALSYLGSPFEVFSHLFVAEIKAKYSGISKIVGIVFISVYRLLLIWFEADLIWFAVALSTEKIGNAAIIMYYYYKADYKTSKLKAEMDTILYITKQCLPLIVTGFGNTIFFIIGQVMVKLLLDDEQTGLYAAAYRISEVWYFIPVIVTSTLYPSLVASYNRSQEEYYAKLMSLINFLTIMSIVIVGGIVLFGDYIITTFLGQSYVDSITVLKLQILGIIPVFIGEPARRALIIENKQKLIMIYSLLAAALNLALNYWLIPQYGIIGATWASLISLFCAFFLFHILYKGSRTIMLTQIKGMLSLKMLEVLK